MNNRLDINKQNDIWSATLIEYDPLPFDKRPENTIDSVQANSLSELLVEIGNKKWGDLINKNY